MDISRIGVLTEESIPVRWDGKIVDDTITETIEYSDGSVLNMSLVVAHEVENMEDYVLVEMEDGEEIVIHHEMLSTFLEMVNTPDNTN